MGIDSDPCHCIATDTDMALSGNSVAPWAGTLPWPQLAGLGTHNRLLVSSLESPVPFLFIRLKLLHFSSPPMPPDTCTLWWFPLQAGCGWWAPG